MEKARSLLLMLQHTDNLQVRHCVLTDDVCRPCGPPIKAAAVMPSAACSELAADETQLVANVLRIPGTGYQDPAQEDVKGKGP